MTEVPNGPVLACGAVDCSMRIPAVSVQASSASTVELGLEPPVRSDPRHDAIDRWGVALTEHDDVEVDRLVRQSRADRVEGATSGRLGPMLGQLDTSSPIVSAE